MQNCKNILTMATQKVNINVRIPVGIKKWLDELAEEGMYGNPSDIIRLAILQFKEKLEKERREEERQAERIIKILKENPELKEKVIKALSDGG